MEQTTETTTTPAEQAESAARQLAMVLLNVGPYCRHCGKPFRTAKATASFLAGKRVKCASCSWYGTWRDGTILHNNPLSCLKFIALFYRYSLGDKPQQVAVHLRISAAIVRQWQQRISQLVANDQ